MKQNDITGLPKLFKSTYSNLFTVHTDDNGKYFYNILRNVNFPSDLSGEYYDTYVIKVGDTWPFISYTFYDDVRLWWLLCAVNNIKNSVYNPPVGYVLKILKPEIVKSILNDISE